ncbi:unnamed protein product [Nezara viridula]|uniref:Broad-complex n=1 Tax=Nezara viridula TaxID=85310 RepID=A0A9P0E7S5_NEZVI|nr:unnamed protein product [Nezara viridula]
MAADHFCLRWNNYQSNMVSELDILRTEEYLVDVTLCVEGHKFRAHKVILSACSPYFRNVFKENPCEHPVVILKDVSPDDVEALLSFVYQGVVYVSEKNLNSFLQTAELLQIKGLAGAASTFNDEHAKHALAASQQSPVKRRKGAPVRIVKHEDGEDNNSNQTEADDDSSRNDFGEDTIEDMKQEDEEGSIGEESEVEGNGTMGEGAAGVYCSSSVDMRDSEDKEQRINSLQRPDTLLHQAMAARQQQQPQATIIPGQYQVPVTTGNQGAIPDFLSPQGGGDRNGKRPCPLCTKVISNKSNLLKHMRIRHSDAYNPACCMLCNKVFKNKYSLRAHLNIYHKEYIAPPPGVQGGPQVVPPPQPVPMVTDHQLAPPPQPQYLSGV